MTRVLPFIVALGLLAAGTYYQGLADDRWGVDVSAELQAFADRIDQIPNKIGQWEMVADQELSEKEWEATNCVNYISWVFQHPNGQRASVYVVAGSGRHITIHSPDQCFPGAGYEMEGNPLEYRVTLDNADQGYADFARATFLREDATKKEHVLVLWSYSDDGQWRGPTTWAKAEYGRTPAMYKVYITTDLGDSEDMSVQNSANVKLARDLMPVLSSVLFPPAAEEVNADPAT